MVIAAGVLMLAAVVLVVPPLPAVPIRAAALAAGGGIVAAALVHALFGIAVLALLAGIAGAAIPNAVHRRRRLQREQQLTDAWPDALDLIRGGLRAGATLPEAIAEVARRGPQPLRHRFAVVAAGFPVGEDSATALARLRVPSDPIGDRVAGMLAIATEVGSADTGEVLASLTHFVRAELVQRREVAARHSWNVAAARVAVAAPWATVALLSLQPANRAAYSAPLGGALLAVVAIAGWVAYRLMMHIGSTEGFQ